MEPLDGRLRPDGSSRNAGGIGGHRVVVMADFTGRPFWVWWTSGHGLPGHGSVGLGQPPNPKLARLQAEKEAWEWVRGHGRLSAEGKEAVDHRLSELGREISVI
jgi:hypothetical protein